MQLENRFDVPASPEAAWALLNDVPAVLPCMPGAELLEVVDGDAWKAKLQVRLGPISLQFLADVRRETSELAERTAVLAVDAREARGRGAASATITSSVAAATGGSSVSIVTELALRGPLAQYGRPIVAPVAEQLTQQFAACISRKLATAADEPAQDGGPPKPLGLRLVLGAVWRSLTRRRAS
jgi:uncharacterized protein